jgi:GDPmannose 4,6-dehydratase
MWLILQQDTPDDYVLATGEAHSVREFVELAFACTERPILWRGHALKKSASTPAPARSCGSR